MTANVNDLQLGDVLVYKGTSIISKAIQFFDGSDASHAALYVGQGEVIEAIASGLEKRDYQTSFPGNDWIKVRRLVDKPSDMQPVVDVAESLHAEGQRYAFEQLVFLAFLCTTRKLDLKPRLRWALRRILDAAAEKLASMMENGDQPVICSELVFRAYQEAIPNDDSDKYEIKLSGAMAGAAGGAPPGDIAGADMDMGLKQRVVEPGSLAAIFGDAVGQKLDESALEGEPEPLAGEPTDDTAAEMLEAALQEIAPPGDMAGPEMGEATWEELRASTDSFVVRLHQARQQEIAQGPPMDLAGVSDGDIAFAYDALTTVQADFVTPADLLHATNLTDPEVVAWGSGAGRALAAGATP